MRYLPFILLGIASLVGTAPPAVAQQSTSATYQDWILQCQMTGTPPQKFCVISQTTQVRSKEQNELRPLTRLMIEKPAKGRPTRLAVQVPVNVLIAGNLHIQTSKTDVAGIVAPFEFCVPAGCIARFDLTSEMLQKFRAADVETKTAPTKDSKDAQSKGGQADGPGKISFKDAGGHDIAVPLSFKGFRQAFDALGKE